jgi:hypothetical protein
LLSPPVPSASNSAALGSVGAAIPLSRILFALTLGLGMTISELAVMASGLRVGLPAQSEEYNRWFRNAKEKLTLEEAASVDRVTKLDLTSETQFAVLHRALRKNMACINFWLNHKVFPAETVVFPRRMESSGFNLTDPSTCVRQCGFRCCACGFVAVSSLLLLLRVQLL